MREQTLDSERRVKAVLQGLKEKFQKHRPAHDEAEVGLKLRLA